MRPLLPIAISIFFTQWYGQHYLAVEIAAAMASVAASFECVCATGDHRPLIRKSQDCKQQPQRTRQAELHFMEQNQQKEQHLKCKNKASEQKPQHLRRHDQENDGSWSPLGTPTKRNLKEETIMISHSDDNHYHEIIPAARNYESMQSPGGNLKIVDKKYVASSATKSASVDIPNDFFVQEMFEGDTVSLQLFSDESVRHISVKSVSEQNPIHFGSNDTQSELERTMMASNDHITHRQDHSDGNNNSQQQDLAGRGEETEGRVDNANSRFEHNNVLDYMTGEITTYTMYGEQVDRNSGIPTTTVFITERPPRHHIGHADDGTRTYSDGHRLFAGHVRTREQVYLMRRLADGSQAVTATPESDFHEERPYSDVGSCLACSLGMIMPSFSNYGRNSSDPQPNATKPDSTLPKQPSENHEPPTKHDEEEEVPSTIEATTQQGGSDKSPKAGNNDRNHMIGDSDSNETAILASQEVSMPSEKLQETASRDSLVDPMVGPSGENDVINALEDDANEKSSLDTDSPEDESPDDNRADNEVNTEETAENESTDVLEKEGSSDVTEQNNGSAGERSEPFQSESEEKNSRRVLRPQRQLGDNDNNLSTIDDDDDDDPSFLDVMVIYSQRAMCQAAGFATLQECRMKFDVTTQETIESIVELSVMETTMAFQNSLIPTALRLVHIAMDSKLDETALSDIDLGDHHKEGHDLGVEEKLLLLLQGSDDSYFDYVHSVRDVVGADFVVLVAALPQYCGMGLQPKDHPPSDMTAFAVVDWTCSSGHYSFANVLGQTMGCQSNPPHVTKQVKDHNWAYQDPDSRFRTIMSGPCPNTTSTSGVDSSFCPRIPYFSNPDATYGSLPVGTTMNNNAGHIISGLQMFANYRRSKVSVARDTEEEIAANDNSHLIVKDAEFKTTLRGGSTTSGNMFTIKTKDHPITVVAFDIHTVATDPTLDIVIMTRRGGLPKEGNGADERWVTICDIDDGVGSASLKGTSVFGDYVTPVDIPVHSEQSFYISLKNGDLHDTKWDLASMPAEDDYISISDSVARAWPFSTIDPGRLWNGAIVYDVHKPIDVASSFAFNGILGTTMEGGNGSSGMMFDVQAVNSDIAITSLWFHTYHTDIVDVDIWVGNEFNKWYQVIANDSTSWRQIGEYRVQGQGPGKPTMLPENSFEIVVPSGRKLAFYIGLGQGGLRYTNGAAPRDAEQRAFRKVTSRNAELKIYEGSGVGTDFLLDNNSNCVFHKRIFNGALLYSTAEEVASYQLNLDTAGGKDGWICNDDLECQAGECSEIGSSVLVVNAPHKAPIVHSGLKFCVPPHDIHLEDGDCPS